MAAKTIVFSGRILHVARLTDVRMAGRAHNPKVVSAAGGKSHTRYNDMKSLPPIGGLFVLCLSTHTY